MVEEWRKERQVTGRVRNEDRISGRQGGKRDKL